ncbi:polyadenylate-binding protein RBP47-like [Senna tora]|uniref:Polyadenylate-binding protein RBP47-like n=1 Tax=Senna tora TaxID=362788 RepID=A0A835CGP0_9FABA|nr:polyadenylate-binding protein RBP47-like [Senna tora]
MAQPTNSADLNQHQHQQQWTQQPHQYQQQWMAMQYPAAAMAMMQQQMMMYPQHYMPYVHHYPPPHQQQQQLKSQPQPPPPSHQQYQQQKQGSSDEIRTIWLGDLHHWMGENYLHSCFAHTGEVKIASLFNPCHPDYERNTSVDLALDPSLDSHLVAATIDLSFLQLDKLNSSSFFTVVLSAKVIRNKQTGQSEGYGFVEFYSRATAEKVLNGYNGTMMPNTDQPFRLNWATFSAGDRRSDASTDLSIFVGDLAVDVTDAMLQETFASRFTSVKGAKVVIDSNTGRSKGYGFVRFADENERTRAMTEMNGVYCSSRPMRIGVATPKKSYGYQQQYSSQVVVLANGHSSNGAIAQGSQPEGDASNTTIFVGGLDSDVSDEDLRQPFLQFGEVVSVKIPVGKGCGFVQFSDRKNAEEAIQALNGTVIGKQTVRLSWGRSPGNKHWRTDSNGGHYGSNGYATRQNQDMSSNPAASVQGASS